MLRLLEMLRFQQGHKINWMSDFYKTPTHLAIMLYV